MKFNYNMRICPYIINWKRGPSLLQGAGMLRGSNKKVANIIDDQALNTCYNHFRIKFDEENIFV